MSNTHDPIAAATFFESLAKDPEYRKRRAEREPALNLARNVFRLRVTQGLTQRELARRAGMRQPRIAEIEGARGNPGILTVHKIARALGTTIENVLAAPDAATLLLDVRTAPTAESHLDYRNAATREIQVEGESTGDALFPVPSLEPSYAS
jgi:transcriptional regulator with XRE-family HTH domain